MRELNNVKKRKALRSSLVMIMLAACVCLAQICLAYGLKRQSERGGVGAVSVGVFVHDRGVSGDRETERGKIRGDRGECDRYDFVVDPARMWLSAGNVALLIRAAALAAYLAFQESILRTYHPVTVAVVSQFMGAIMGIVISLPWCCANTF